MNMAMDRRLVIGPAGLPGELMVPAEARGLVVFAHGSGSGRRSPRNRTVASQLRQQRFGTLLVDLLRPEEAIERARVFDIGLLASRLGDCLDWLDEDPHVRELPLGLLGAGTGAAAALDCAAARGPCVGAVVCRSGRPDLASTLGAVRSPTLLVVGSADPEVLTLNVEARGRMGGQCHVAVVPGASHLFPEPGTLERAAALAIDWFVHGLAPARTSRSPRAPAQRGPEQGMGGWQAQAA